MPVEPTQLCSPLPIALHCRQPSYCTLQFFQVQKRETLSTELPGGPIPARGICMGLGHGCHV